MKQIAGWADFTSVPGWDDDFTVNSSGRGIDLAWASRDVLFALPGMTPEIVDRFLKLRQGPDGIDGTEDDGIQNLPEAGAALGFNQDQLDLLTGVNRRGNGGPLPTPIVCFKQDLRFRVASVGTAGKAKRTVQMVFGKGNPPSVITWKEF
jgi:hypothetical protein